MGSIKLSYVGCSGRPGPTKVVELELASEWRQERRGLIIATPVTVAITSFGPRMPLAVGLTHLRPSQWSVREEGSRRSHDLAIPLRDQEIRFIEDHRGGADLELHISFDWVMHATSERDMQTSGGRFRLREPFRQQEGIGAGYRIAASDWQHALEASGVGARRWFDAPLLPLGSDEYTEAALTYLDDAKAALEGGNWSDVVGNCRAAVEAAGYADGSQKPNWDRWLKAGVPDDKHRAELNAVLTALREHAQTVARHAKPPFIRAVREEAEFVYVTTISFFSMISRLMERRLREC